MEILDTIGSNSKIASFTLATLTTQDKNYALKNISNIILERQNEILLANNIDVEIAKKNNLSPSLLDRLILTEERIESISQQIEEIINLDDPVGEISSMKTHTNQLQIGVQSVPLGVIGLIYESRPNVTIDATALCIKSGNCVILKGGSDAINTNIKIVEFIRESLKNTKVPINSVQLISDTSRETVQEFMKLNKYVDVLIPRGGYSLIKSVINNSTIPVIETGVGNCHIFVDEWADIEMARKIVVSAKVNRPGVCNSLETLLVHKKIAPIFLPIVINELKSHNVEIRGCDYTKSIYDNVVPLKDSDLETEFLDLILALKVVSDIDEAISHINTYGTKHSESIITNNYQNSRKFQNSVDAAAVYINASTRFTDGNEFGKGAEIGISTQKLHARGPIGLKELTTSKYIIFGNGQYK